VMRSEAAAMASSVLEGMVKTSFENFAHTKLE